MTNEMRYIYEIYKLKSFSKAAEKLFITQPALSISVQKVEQALGTPIFYRNHKSLALTEAGKKYIEAIERIDTIEKDLSCEINDLMSVNTGSLAIGGTQYINSYILPPVIGYFTQKHPNVSLKIIENPSNRLLDSLEDGVIDLTYNCGDMDKDKFTSCFAFRDRVLLAVPRHFVSIEALPYALSRDDVLLNTPVMPMRPYVSLNLFSDIPFILLTTENNLYERSIAFLEEAGISPVIALETSQLVTAYRLCCSGIGATFISSYLVSESSPQNVVYFKIDSPLSARNFHAVLNKKRYVSFAVRAFIDAFNQIHGEDGLS